MSPASSRPSSPHRDERGVSPVIGVVLMVAITVVLAAVIAGMAMGFEEKLHDPAPIGGFDKEYVADGEGNTDNRPYVRVTHELGETVDADDILIRDESGNEIYWNDIWTGGERVEAGEYVHLDGFASDSVLDPICSAGDTYYVIYQREDGSSIVHEWEAPKDPNPPPGSAADLDADGDVDWC